MMLSTRQKAVITNLSAEMYTTSQELAKKCNVSDRTIRSEIKAINDCMDEYGIQILSKPKMGYKLIIVDSQLAMEALQNESIDEENDRSFAIIEYMILKGDFVKTDELCEMLYISPSTISQDLKSVRQILKQYRLQLESKPYTGIRIKGKEFDIRACISGHLIGSKKIHSSIVSEQQYAILSDILKQCGQDYQYELNNYSFENLVCHIAIAMKRIQRGNSISIPLEKQDEFRQYDTYLLSKAICKKVSDVFDIHFTEEECCYLSLHLYGKRIISGKPCNRVINSEVYELVDMMLKRIDEEFNLNLCLDLDIRMGLSLHLIPLLERIHHHMNMKNPLLEEIKDNYTFAYIISQTACSVISDKYSVTVSDDEVGYVALYLSIALSRQDVTIQKKNIMIICSAGRSSAEFLANQYQHEFGKYIDQIRLCDYLNVDQIDWTGIDLAFSTVEIDGSIPVPLIRIPHMLHHTEKEKIEKKLSRQDYSIVCRYFDEHLFYTRPVMDSKEEAISFLTDQISKYGRVPTNFKDLVMLREEKGSTQISKLVAMPHPYRSCTEETIVSVLILDEPLLWGENKVQLVFLISVGRKKDEWLQLFYQVLSEIMTNKNIVKRILRTRSFLELCNIITEVEKEMHQ